MAISIQLKRGPSTNLGNITAKDGELVWLTDEKRFRVGSDDGTTQSWQTLSYAQIDSNGLVPSTQLPIDDTAGVGDTGKLLSADEIANRLTSGATYLGLWNPDGSGGPGTPALSDGTGDNGDFYIVETGGDADFGSGTITFIEGDRVMYQTSDNTWKRIVSANSVDSVNGQTGVVILGMNDINDVIIDSGTLAADDYIKWDPTADGGNGAWVNAAPQSVAIDDLSDVDTTTVAPTVGQTLKWDGTNWTPQDDNNSIASLDDIGDVNVTGVTDGQIIVWDDASGEWQASDLPTGVDGTFIGLTDTPSAYNSGDAGKFVKVNAAEDGLEFVEVTTDGIAEGSTNLYYTDARVDGRIAAANIEDLANVTVTSVSDNEILQWNSSTSQWENVAISNVTVQSIDDLDDVDTSTTAPTDGQTLKWDAANSQWVPADDIDTDTTYTSGTGIFIDEEGGNSINLDAGIDLLTDVDTTTTAPSTDDVLSWDGTNWVPTAIDGGQF